MCINYNHVYDMVKRYTPFPISTHESVCSAAVKTASDINASLIIVVTENGLTARLIAKYKPKQQILALS